MVTDPIADMLTRIRNANQQRHAEVVIPASKLKADLAEILKNEGFIKGYKGLKRVSKPGLRQYAKVNEIPKVLNGLGIVVLSTSQGLMTDKEARAKQVGGEVLAYIW